MARHGEYIVNKMENQWIASVRRSCTKMGQRRNYFRLAREEKRERKGLSVTLERVYPLSPSDHLWLPPLVHSLHLVYPPSFRSFLLFVLAVIVFFGTI